MSSPEADVTLWGTLSKCDLMPPQNTTSAGELVTHTRVHAQGTLATFLHLNHGGDEQSPAVTKATTRLTYITISKVKTPVTM